MPQLYILFHQIKPPVLGMSSILLSQWSNELHGKPQTSQAIAKHCSPLTDVKAPLYKTTLTYVFEHREVKPN